MPKSFLRAILFPAALATLAVGAFAAPASANEPGESDESAQLVREAIALIVNTPDNPEAAEEKVLDALEAPMQDGVDLDLVAEAAALFPTDDTHAVRRILERSIGAQLHTGEFDPLPIPETRGTPGMPMATGAESGTDVAIDPLAADRDLSANDWAGLAGLLALAATGIWLAVRFRPVPSHPVEHHP